MRVIGVDFGDVRTGIAVSDESMVLASGVGTVTAKGLSALADRIGEYCRMYGASKIVMGRPLNMDDTAGPRAEKADRFAAILRERTGLEVILTEKQKKGHRYAVGRDNFAELARRREKEKIRKR